MLPAYLRGRDLVPVARLRTRREGVRAQGAEIVDDNVSVLEGQRVARRFREVEVELLEGDERTLRRLEKELRRAGAESAGELQPKLYRALGLAGPIEAVEIPGHVTARGDRPRVRAAVPGVAAHDPGVRRGDDTEETASAARRDAAPPSVPAGRSAVAGRGSGRSRCAPSSAGSAASRARPATST